MRNEESSLIVILIAVLVASVMLSFRRTPVQQRGPVGLGVLGQASPLP